VLAGREVFRLAFAAAEVERPGKEVPVQSGFDQKIVTDETEPGALCEVDA